MSDRDKLRSLLDLVPIQFYYACAQAAQGISEFQEAADAVTDALREEVESRNMRRECAIGEPLLRPRQPFLAGYRAPRDRQEFMHPVPEESYGQYKPTHRHYTEYEHMAYWDSDNRHLYAEPVDGYEGEMATVASANDPMPTREYRRHQDWSDRYQDVPRQPNSRPIHPTARTHAVTSLNDEKLEPLMSSSAHDQQMENLIAAMQALMSQHGSENGCQKLRSGCLVCCDPGHRKARCEVLKEWLREKKVIINDFGHVAFPDGRSIPITRMGMIAAVEREAGIREGRAAAAAAAGNSPAQNSSVNSIRYDGYNVDPYSQRYASTRNVDLSCAGVVDDVDRPEGAQVASSRYADGISPYGELATLGILKRSRVDRGSSREQTPRDAPVRTRVRIQSLPPIERRNFRIAEPAASTRSTAPSPVVVQKTARTTSTDNAIELEKRNRPTDSSSGGTTPSGSPARAQARIEICLQTVKRKK
ncbi:hypothetical protein IWW36_004165 [Coemansia brasiliensis]|uniref:Uncharacterized protein n=1 Tax=Coemansia brasiliensis TaxID=2650707 RepID=A0A9W8I6A2_9FUNG|nr:hypothetical protein IWW36_004165 [Coemansia brasiliensis]